jgi:mannose-6-phosphate isomerase-like protein (cupin superfamily)
VEPVPTLSRKSADGMMARGGMAERRHPRHVDRARVATEWRARGFGCDLWTDPPGQVWADFTHATDELVMLVEGRIELEFLGKTLHPDAGEEILIPAGASHTVRNIGGVTARWLYGYRRR